MRLKFKKDLLIIEIKIITARVLLPVSIFSSNIQICEGSKIVMKIPLGKHRISE